MWAAAAWSVPWYTTTHLQPLLYLMSSLTRWAIFWFVICSKLHSLAAAKGVCSSLHSSGLLVTSGMLLSVPGTVTKGPYHVQC